MKTLLIFIFFFYSCLSQTPICNSINNKLEVFVYNHTIAVALPQFKEVIELQEELVASGKDLGGNTAATWKGCLALNMYSGIRNTHNDSYIFNNTLTQTFSVGKTLASFAIMHLVYKGKVTYDTPIYTFWSEFKNNGKESITVGHLTSYTSCLPTFDDFNGRPLFVNETLDSDLVESVIEATAPVPGCVIGKHGGYALIYYANFIDIVVRKLTQKSLEQYLRDEVLNVIPGSEIYFTPNSTLDNRITECMNETTRNFLNTFEPFFCSNPFFALQCKVIRNPIGLQNAFNVNDPTVRYVLYAPGASVYSNAETFAQLFGMAAFFPTARIKGLWDRDIVEQANTEVFRDFDYVLLGNVSYTLGGFSRPTPLNPFSDFPDSFAKTGTGGQIAVGVPKLKMGFARLTPNEWIISGLDNDNTRKILDSVTNVFLYDLDDK